MGHYAEALKALNIAIEINGNYKEARYNRSLTHYALGMFNEALDDIRIGVALNPTSRLYQKQRKKCLGILGLNAEESLEQTMITPPKLAPALISHTYSGERKSSSTSSKGSTNLKQEKRALINQTFDVNERLKKFGVNFYQRLANFNALKDEKENPISKTYTNSKEDRRYDAIARLFETSGKSCCAVCFDGEQLLIAFNEDVFPSQEEFGQPTFAYSILPYVIKATIFESHLKSIAKISVELKRKRHGPASAFFEGGEELSINMLRYGFLEKTLPFNMDNSEVAGLIYNILLRFGEFEKNYKSNPVAVVDAFWKTFSDYYDLEASLKLLNIPFNMQQLEIFKRFLDDIIKIENFIASLPLEHPFLKRLTSE